MAEARVETTTSRVHKHEQMSEIWRRAEFGRHRTHYLKLVGIFGMYSIGCVVDSVGVGGIHVHHPEGRGGY